MFDTMENLILRDRALIQGVFETDTRCPFRKSCASAPLGTPGSSPAPEATLERGAPRESLENWWYIYETDI
jgi:hypothetical protein